MLAFVFQVCILDGKHVEESETYKRLVAFFGKDFADSLTLEEEVIITHPPPEGMMPDDR